MAAVLLIAAAAWLGCLIWRRCAAAHPPPSPVIITQADLERDAALRGLGKPSSTTAAGKRARQPRSARAGQRGDNNGLLLLGEASSTDAVRHNYSLGFMRSCLGALRCQQHRRGAPLSVGFHAHPV